jgi:hypothetical protein
MNDIVTAHELARELLAGPDLPVHISYNYGDRQRTTVTPGVSRAEEARVRYSDYHQMDRLCDEPESDDERAEYEEATKAIVLS